VSANHLCEDDTVLNALVDWKQLLQPCAWQC